MQKKIKIPWTKIIQILFVAGIIALGLAHKFGYIDLLAWRPALPYK